MSRHLLYIITLVLYSYVLAGQTTHIPQDTIKTTTTQTNKLTWQGDFRFRIEHDWNSRKSDGTYRQDRSRLRYRFRVGVSKQLKEYFKVEARIRTGDLENQQGPHVTLGKTSEFGLTSIGFEKSNLQYNKGRFWAWIGKNSFPFWKQHELLWNDNVFPEGIAMGFRGKSIKKKVFITPTIGHFVINSEGGLFGQDQFLSVVELNIQLKNNEYQQFIYNVKNLFFNNISNVPDGKGDFYLAYNILASSFCYKQKLGNQPLTIGLDWYQNTSDYQYHQEWSDLMEEKIGYTIYLKYGYLRSKGDFLATIYYAHIGKYAVVDYFAQNDWARWDYSNLGAVGSRLSNFNGVELRLGYKITNAVDFIARFYQVEQLITTGSHLETGTRFRIDLNAEF